MIPSTFPYISKLDNIEMMIILKGHVLLMGNRMKRISYNFALTLTYYSPAGIELLIQSHYPVHTGIFVQSHLD